MAQFQKRMITIVGIIMIVGVTVIFLSSSVGDHEEKAPRFVDSANDIDYYYYDSGMDDYYGIDDYYGSYNYYGDLYDDYDGLHYDEFVPASEPITKEEVIEEFLGVSPEDGEALDEYLIELVEEEIVQEYGLDAEEEEMLDEYLQELVGDADINEYLYEMVEDEILDEYVANMVQEELLDDEIISNEIDQNYMGAERLEAIEEVLVARQEYLMNAYNVIEEEKTKHEMEEMKKANPKIVKPQAAVKKNVPRAKPYKAPTDKLKMAQKLTNKLPFGKT